MPIYEYRCIDHGHHFEEFQKISDPPIEKCKICGGKVKKVISSTSFQLKGCGWYKDGYANCSNAQTVSKKEKTSSEGKKDSSSKTEKSKT